MRSQLLALGTAGGLLASSGCAVYIPTVPATPLIKQGQVEAYVGLRALTLPEAGVAWAPRPHLLLSAEVAGFGGNGYETVNGVTTTYQEYHRQASVGVGYYRASPAPQGWYVAVLGGVGLAGASLRFPDVTTLSPYLPIPIIYHTGTYEARYWRGYVQGYVAKALEPKLWGGISVRGTLVGYQHLAYSGQDIQPTARGFIEPTFFMRFGRGILQGQGMLGVSLPTSGNPDNPFNKRTAPVSTLLGASLIVRPDLLWHRGD